MARVEFGDGDEDAYVPEPWEIAGFDLFGERQDDGSIKLGSRSQVPGFPDTRTHLPAFPEAVAVVGVDYTLEFVKENEWEGRAEVEKANPDDPRLRICWGIYV